MGGRRRPLAFLPPGVVNLQVWQETTAGRWNPPPVRAARD